MIERLFKPSLPLAKTADSALDMPNATITGHIDNGAPLILSQEGRDICITGASGPELCKL
jgi:hypothetical protein